MRSNLKVMAGLAAWLMAAAGCGGGSKGKGDGGEEPASIVGGGKVGDDGRSSKGGGKSGKSGKSGGGKGSIVAGGGASLEAAQNFTAWTPLHAFLGAPVVAGSVVSPTEAIVFTKDNHVGVTLDGGVSWGFERMTTGSVRAVAGAPGGPFVVVGAGGFFVLSADGKIWSDLPRYTNDELWNVAVGEGKVVAVGKNGSFVTMSQDGTGALAGVLPNKFKASGVIIGKAEIKLTSGKKVMISTDGQTWSPGEDLLASGGKEAPTDQGLCTLGKVGKKKGVVCSVAGAAYGVGGKDVLVVGKSFVMVSKNGGQSWSVAPMPIKGVKVVNGKAGGPYHVGDGKAFVASSTDGKTWTPGTDLTVLDGAPAWPKPAKCDEGVLPGEGMACTLAKQVTSPEGLPEVRGLRAGGNVLMGMGDAALVVMSTDGGATWKSASGFALGGVQGFDLKGDKAVAVGKTRAAVSTDAGKSFRAVELPPKTPALIATRIAEDGSVYLVGKAGTILKSDPEVTAFTRLDTGPKNKTDYIALHEVGGALYAAGSKGQLHRSSDKGAVWTPIATGLNEPIQKMSGEGELVLAISSPARYGGNKLLRSNDNGERFFVQRELSDQGYVHDFSFEGGELVYDNFTSSDFGATWTKRTDWYWAGSVDVADDSGMRISNVGSYNGKDRFYVIGPEKEDFTVVDSFYNKGGWLRCAESSGCWMVAAGQVYRPR